MFFQEKYVNRDKELEAEKEEILAEEDAIIAGGSTGNEKYGGEEEEPVEEVDEELEVGLTCYRYKSLTDMQSYR